MNLVHKIESWGNAHHPKILDIIRIALGIFLFLKGVVFMNNTADLANLIAGQHAIVFSSSLLVAIIYYVTFVHMVGGIMIMLGILTRFSCIMQIPIVLGAVLFNDFLISPINAQLSLSLTALAFLVIFVIIGSGPLSLDKYLENNTLNDD